MDCADNNQKIYNLSFTPSVFSPTTENQIPLPQQCLLSAEFTDEKFFLTKTSKMITEEFSGNALL